MSYPARRNEKRTFDKAALMREIAREQKKKERAKIADLEARIRSLVHERRGGREAVRAYCDQERAAARSRILRLQDDLRAELRRLSRDERLEARGRCDRARRGPSIQIGELRRKLEEERRFLVEMRRIESEQRATRRPITPSRVVTSESDDEVRQNIPEDLIPLFERVKRSIRPGLRKSRTEAFLEYVESHPREQYSAVEDKTDELIREMQRRQRSGRDMQRRR